MVSSYRAPRAGFQAAPSVRLRISPVADRMQRKSREITGVVGMGFASFGLNQSTTARPEYAWVK